MNCRSPPWPSRCPRPSHGLFRTLERALRRTTHAGRVAKRRVTSDQQPARRDVVFLQRESPLVESRSFTVAAFMHGQAASLAQDVDGVRVEAQRRRDRLRTGGIVAHRTPARRPWRHALPPDSRRVPARVSAAARPSSPVLDMYSRMRWALAIRAQALRVDRHRARSPRGTGESPNQALRMSISRPLV